MKKEKRIWTKWFYWFTFAVAVIGIYKLLDNYNDIKNWFSSFMNTIMPFILGIIIAYILYIPARSLEKLIKKMKKLEFITKRARGISVILVYIIAILILVLIINYLLPIISASIIDFVNHFQDYYNIITKEYLLIYF